ncbi:Hypothetical protein R9X50_00255900 [Acrodontium crateriforme]|uniref:Vesicle-mediated transport protein Vid24 n=1 Tax=Acrodontium crateriforme TaxID=150365 RepID=A0AAQ3M4H7_9PEZI|nr:Hypothetical protein R9X50_00255900 [Acrodontium crateriforme]
MPTPSHPEPLTHSALPADASPLHSTFASCPEEPRDSHNRSESSWPTAPSTAAARSHGLDDEHMTTHESSSDSETIVASSETAQELQDKTNGDKLDALRNDPAVDSDAPNPQIRVDSPDASSESDERLARSMSATAISPSYSPQPEYLSFPTQRHRHLTQATSSFLRPGSKFQGTQQSDRQRYDVQVEIKDVDMAESFLCGYLRIQGLTDDHPTLTTFFEGEIIGPKYKFRTAHPSWGSSEKVDYQHWNRFTPWAPLARAAKSPNFTLNNFDQREHLWMRWKEYFLVPDHRVKTITGASFEGFYYICFNQCTGSVEGVYFHAKSEKFQKLELDHVDDRGCMGAVEFR